MEVVSGQTSREEIERDAEEERDSENEEGVVGGGLEPFELQPSIVDVVAKLCPKNEADEIWRVVGRSLVEQAKDLLEEASALLEIWRQLKEDADQAVSPVSSPLPEPPMVRERLIQEICFLADHLREIAPLRPTPPLSGEGSREILDYIRGREGSGSGRGSSCRPQSAVSSRDGRETPLRHTPSSEEGSQSSVLSNRFVPDEVSVLNIDTAMKHLRDTLEEEIVQRKEDISFLQSCVEGEREHVTAQSRPPPSLRTLREFGSQLEREVLQVAEATPRGRGLHSAGRRLVPQSPSGQCPNQGLHNLRRASRINRPKPFPHPSPLTPHPPLLTPPPSQSPIHLNTQSHLQQK